MAEALSQQSLQERLRLREERKQQEELMKAFETPEEKRARRLAKKEAKERKKREKMGWGEEYMGYTNTDNPFGDNNLLGTFIWNKVSPSQPRSTCRLVPRLCPLQILPAFLFVSVSCAFYNFGFKRHYSALRAHVCRLHFATKSLSYTHMHTHTTSGSLCPLTSLRSA